MTKRTIQNELIALGLRAEGVPGHEIGRVSGLTTIGLALRGRRRVRGVPYYGWAPGMVDRKGKHVEIIDAYVIRPPELVPTWERRERR